MIACLYHPHLSAGVFESRGERGPFLVVESGRVVGYSPSIERHGIVVGMPIDRARALVPTAHVRGRDRLSEEIHWESIIRRVWLETPFMESDRPGLVFARGIAVETVRSLARTLQAHAAFADHRSYAHLAALRAAHGNTLIVRDIDPFLGHCPVEMLLDMGFDTSVVERFLWFGMPTLAQVAALGLRPLTAQFGGDGRSIYDLLHPQEERRLGLYRPPLTIQRSVELEGEVLEIGRASRLLGELVRAAHAELNENTCSILELAWEAESGEERRRKRILKEPTGDRGTLERLANFELPSVLQPAEGALLQLSLGGLRPRRAVQADLFSRRIERQLAVKAVERRYPRALRIAVIDPDALLPEDRVRLEYAADAA